LKRSLSEKAMITLKADEEGFISISDLIKEWPVLKDAVSYKLFPKKNKTLHLRFYNKKGKWIRIK
jgi:hypothetical protein